MAPEWESSHGGGRPHKELGSSDLHGTGSGTGGISTWSCGRKRRASRPALTYIHTQRQREASNLVNFSPLKKIPHGFLFQYIPQWMLKNNNLSNMGSYMIGPRTSPLTSGITSGSSTKPRTGQTLRINITIHSRRSAPSLSGSHSRERWVLACSCVGISSTKLILTHAARMPRQHWADWGRVRHEGMGGRCGVAVCQVSSGFGLGKWRPQRQKEAVRVHVQLTRTSARWRLFFFFFKRKKKALWPPGG